MDYLWEQLRHKMLLDLWQKSSKFVDETDLLENNLYKCKQMCVNNKFMRVGYVFLFL